ncbi:DUF1127 domain-containing protein [Cognatishimia sp. SS12]|uniref:DUF1127 domain-containing protein n=1 Tax=Cognatishimia sp. SS12 TaxID=2979465 RepID=UPI002330C5A8|nr:DUF1127 domain-containing protein [Cognatishimia sp. SS12]MDC0738789.1 DUF1127 domain-containing protein [Cognatishimia sp. SS12]
MAALDTNRVHSAFGGRIGQTLAAMVSTVVAWNESRKTRALLSQLSDRELLDVGLTRGDIHTIV